MRYPAHRFLFTAACIFLALAGRLLSVEYTVLHRFALPPGNPSVGAMVVGPNDEMWGATVAGGTHDKGTIFAVKKDGTGYRTIVSFTGTSGAAPGSAPTGGLLDDGAGNFLGTTSAGGSQDMGTVFRLNKATGEVTTLVDFTGPGGLHPGSAPKAGLTAGGAGYWGTTSLGGSANAGTVFFINRTTLQFGSILHFTGGTGPERGSLPYGRLMNDDSGNLYGTTSHGGIYLKGTIFKINIASESFEVVWDFSGSDGEEPWGELVDDFHGNFWGTTRYGGTSNKGTVFRFYVAAPDVNPVVNFNGGGFSGKGAEPLGGLVMDSFGDFWGTASTGGQNDSGVVFRVQTNGNFVAPIHFVGSNGVGGTSGGVPAATLVYDGSGFLWGTTQFGGSSGRGAVFKVDPESGGGLTMHEFADADAGQPGYLPQTALVSDGQGNLWGTTSNGGASGFGTIYKLNVDTGALTTVKEFTGVQGAVAGAEPRGDLLLTSDGMLWGTTRRGGYYDFGTIFKIDPVTGAFTSVRPFEDAGIYRYGRYPLGGLVQDLSGRLWGTTSEGGSGLSGTLYNLTTDRLGFAQQFGLGPDFGTPVGPGPAGRLVGDGNGNLFGVTAMSTLFKVNTGTLAFEPTTFGSQIGTSPLTSLFMGANSSLWGTASAGGGQGLGTIFRTSTLLGGTSAAIEFTGTGGSFPGANPRAGLVRAGTDYFMGVTSAGGANNLGTIFRLRESDSAFASLVSFTGTTGAVEGAAPVAALLQVAPGVFYGTASGGGGKGGGVVFKATVGPTATTLAATGITTTTATLQGSASPNGLSTEVAFEWGEDLNVPTKTVVSTLSSGAGEQSVSLPLSGLIPNTTYYYRVTAINGDTQSPRVGFWLSFTTDELPPVILQQYPTGPITDETLLEALVQVPNPVSVHFEFGTANPPTTSTIAINLDPSQGSVQTTKGLAFQLPRGVPIFYRAVASNRSATTRGPVQQFIVPLDPQSEIVAVRGSAVSGAGTDSRIQAGAVWTKVGVPAITEIGRVVFVASWSAPKQGALPAQTGTGIFIDNVLFKKVGEPAGVGPGIVWKGFLDPVAADGPGFSTEIALIGKIAGPRVSGKNDSVVATTVGHFDGTDAITLSVVAREGDAAPDCDNAKYAKFSSVGIVGDARAGGQPVAVWRGTLASGTGNPKVRATNNDAAWGLHRYFASPGGVLAVREGLRVPDSPVTGDTVKTFSLLQTIPGAMGASAGIGNRDAVTYGYETVGKVKGLGVWRTFGSVDANGISSIPNAFTGGAVFGGPEMWSDPGFAVTSPDGEIGTLGVVSHPASGGGNLLVPTVTRFNLSGLQRIYTSAAITSYPVDLNATYRKFESIAVGWRPFSHLDPAGVAYKVKLAGNNITAANDTAILWQPEVALDFQASLIAREGAQVSGMPVGTFWKDFTSLALPSGPAGPLFTATLKTGKGGVTSANDAGCWAVDSTGALRLLFREGDTIGGKKLRTFNVLKSIPGSPGSSRAYNTYGRVVWQATFTDGSTAAIRTNVP